MGNNYKQKLLVPADQIKDRDKLLKLARAVQEARGVKPRPKNTETLGQIRARRGNPNHDSEGRFTSAEGRAQIRAAQRTAAGKNSFDKSAGWVQMSRLGFRKKRGT